MSELGARHASAHHVAHSLPHTSEVQEAGVPGRERWPGPYSIHHVHGGDWGPVGAATY
jgi:hypothetical protein